MTTDNGARAAAAELAAHDEDRPTEIAVDDALGGEVVTSLLDDTALNEKEQRVMAELFSEFSRVCSGCLGLITGKPYVLPLKAGAIPFACRPFPVPQAYLPPLKKEISRLVELGVLIPDSGSPWAPPASTVPKKDGSIRPVCDFRRLNRLLDRHLYPLPKIAEIPRQL
ncbi:hypothetical protein PF011_g5689 [Phytophthora fragariae]|uniref:Reverse transcriptase domain-containing protein n=1 Tax=Phytophthora fragariae TaxID=53985 RepID=A0A6A3LNL5_9STRA|nr:hypothetical protein PF011_g5689 [Phytophthora fragariae]